MTQVEASYIADSECQQLISQLLISADAVTDHQYVSGLLKRKGKVYIGGSQDLRQQLLQAIHSSPLGGHSGQGACLQRLKSFFYWPKMKQDLVNLIRACPVCQTAKAEHVPYPGLLQPLPIPQHAWSHRNMDMDFIEKLPLSEAHDTIMVVVDRLTKFAHFLPLAHPISANSVAPLFLDQIYKLHGLPEVIVSDRDKIFTSAFWKQLFRLLGITLNLSTAYHPQTDGQTERVNQCVETYLRCFCCDKPASWFHWLALAEHWYNTAHHSSIGMTPFEALFGRKPVFLPCGPYADVLIPAAADLLQQRQSVLQLLKGHLVTAQSRMKYYADQHRSERVFQVGDWVYLKLQPYKQQTLALRTCLKLSAKFYGPFEVLEKIGSVAYKLKLPDTCRLHPVFHISLLKKHVGNTPTNMAPLPEFNNQDISPLTPDAVLQRREIIRDGLPVTQWLIRWKHLATEEASWEDSSFIRNQFPAFQA